jgi:hypothetical protein
MIIDAGGDWESDMYVLSRPPSPHAAASPEAARPGLDSGVGVAATGGGSRPGGGPAGAGFGERAAAARVSRAVSERH